MSYDISDMHRIDCAIARAMGLRMDHEATQDGDGLYVKRNLVHRDSCRPFQPTRNPADAMEVLGWLVRESGPICIHKWDIDGFYVSRALSVSFFAKTLPLAICLFAEKIITASQSK